VTLGERPREEVATLNPEQGESMEESLGFSVTELSASIKEQLQLDSDTEGVVVRNINEGSAAYERGLRRGDVITRVKRNAVTSTTEFYEEVEVAIEGGDEVLLLTVLRNDIEQFVAFEL
jgi:serine protease Do